MLLRGALASPEAQLSLLLCLLGPVRACCLQALREALLQAPAGSGAALEHSLGREGSSGASC